MAVSIRTVEKHSPAAKAGLQGGDTLLTINGQTVEDVLDYRFLMTDEVLELSLERAGRPFQCTVEKEEYEELGLVFDSYLMDSQRSCRNQCIFCFIDQMPKGMRESLYFKDDDARLSFLLGIFITMTNRSRHDIDRIKRMHISPVNVSVHTTNPELRCKMMNNRFAGNCLDIMREFGEAGIKMNCQLVLCPGINDGEELERSMRELAELWPAVESVSAVPVGVTKYREGLYPLQPYTNKEAEDVVRRIGRFGDAFLQAHGVRLIYPSDEFFLKAGLPLPEEEYYDGFPQLDNGVGMLRLFETEFMEEFSSRRADRRHRRLSVATGAAAYPFIQGLVDRMKEKWHNTECTVYRIENEFFGKDVTVSGLVTGGDIIAQLGGKDLGSKLIIPSSMLRFEGDLFLDSVSVDEVQAALKTPIVPNENHGDAFLRALLER